jgi:Leucine-rich repeat (LRR) protein/serine/threonine protein kinase
MDTVKRWKQSKLNSSLQRACRMGNYKLAISLIQAGASNFEQCIKSSTRTNHILAFIRLCQAALEDDRSAIQLILECDEEEINYNHPDFPTLNQYRQILSPLLENGKLSVTTPLQIALSANNVLAAGDILLRSTKHPRTGMVDWHGLDLVDLPAEWLGTLKYPNLSLLCLSFNRLKCIPKEIARFTTLVKLQIASNDISIVHPEIFQLPNIENIDLSYNKIGALPECLLAPISPKLRSLNLSNNQLAVFPDYFGEADLVQLDLSRNRLGEVPPCVCKLRQLESLNISHNRSIKRIPYEIGGLKMLKIFSFDGLPYANNIPVANTTTAPLDFYRSRFKSMQTVTSFEVVVVGFPFFSNVMTTLLKALKESDLLKCSILSYKNPTQFLHLHQIFKSPSALYVIPWDCQISQDANDLHRVLRYLSIFAPQAPVIVAACWKSYMESHSELKIEERIANSLWKDLSDVVLLKHVLLESAEAGMEDPGVYSLETFMHYISQISDKVKTTMFVPGSYYSCNDLLGTIRQQYATEGKCPMLSEWDFWELVRSMPTHDLSSHLELTDLVSFLVEKGTIIHIQCPKQSRDSQDCYVFDRQWLCNVLGNVITNRSALLQESFSGIVRQDGLIDLFADPTLQNPLPNALQYMINHEGIALLMSSEKWLVPSLLRRQPEENMESLQDSKGGIRRQYTFCLTPANFWGRLIAHLQINMDTILQNVTMAIGGGGNTHTSYRLSSGAIDWTYWSRGTACWKDAHHLVYTIEEIEIRDQPFRESIEIRVPNTPFGHRTMCELMFIIDSLLKNWYPEVWQSLEIWVPCSYCIHTKIPDVPSISFQDCLLAVSKGVGVRCIQHLEKIVSIAKIIPDLIQEDVSVDLFLPPGVVAFNPQDKSTCISRPPSETVFKGMYNNHMVAVKPYPHPVPNASILCACSKKKLNITPLLQAWHEFEVLRHLQNAKCPFLVSLTGICVDPLCLVFPFARWSSLEDVLQLKEVAIPHQVRMRMTYQLACALEVVHSLHIIHRNVCLANILVHSLSLDDPVNIKLAGFSDACYSIFQGIGIGSCGSFPAPEMLQQDAGEYDERVDIFAFGFVTYEIVTRNRVHILSSAPLQKQMMSLMDRPSLAPVRSRAPLLTPLITRCWHPDPFKRPFACNIVSKLMDPLHLLAHNGKLVHENHEFFAASARFSRENNTFRADVFVSSGELTGQSNAFLTHVSLPGFDFHSFSPLPKEFVICMGCIGQQLWISFYGKKLRIYSTLDLKTFVNEFCFDHHVVVMGLSPISVYLGFESGMVYMYDVANENVPSEPTNTRMVCREEYKSIEPLEDCVVCATRNKIYLLHPDSLETESEWTIQNLPGRIRSIAISQYSDSQTEDTLWMCFRRLDQVHIFQALTGRPCYTIECATLVGSTAEKVYVLSMRMILDTVWVGLNTGHVLVFETNATKPSLITHFKVHKSEVREILLLHPSYLGPSSVHSTTEMVSIMEKSKTGTFSTVIPDSVYVLCFGTGLHEMIPEVNKTGRLEEITEKDEEMKKLGLYGVVMEGMVASRMKEIERHSSRATLPYMEGYVKTDDVGGLEAIYDVPPDFQYEYDSTDTFLRRTTWTAENTDSPVRSMHLPKMRTISEDDPNDLYVSIERPDDLLKSGSNCSAMSDSPPHLPPRPPDLSADEPASHYSVPRSVKAKESPQVSHYDVPKSSVRKSITNLFKRKKTAVEQRASDEQKAAATQEDESDPDSGYDYPYSYTIPRSMTALSPQKLSADPRRSTMACNRPVIEDSGEYQGYDPYVRMDTFFDPNLRVTATKAKARVQARRELIQHARRGQAFNMETVHHDGSGDGEDDFTTVEDFLSPSKNAPVVQQQQARPAPPPTATKPQVVPRKSAQWTPPRPPKTKPHPSPRTQPKNKSATLDDESASKDLSEEKM